MPVDTWLSLDHVDQVLEIDSENHQVRVGDGIRLHALNRKLAEHGLAANVGLVT